MKKTKALSPIVALLLLLFGAESLPAQWSPLNPGVSNDLHAIDFEGNTIFVGGYQLIVKSTDGGNTWDWNILKDEFSVTLYGSSVYDMHFFDQNTGVATGFILTGNSEVILRTTNGGENWSFVNVFNGGSYPRFLHDIDFPTASTGYAVGTNGRILKSVNAGQSWSPLPSGTTKELYSVHFFDANTGIVAGAEVILKTQNGGSTWSVVNLPGYFLKDMHFLNASTGVAVTGGLVLKTTDGGNTWVPAGNIADDLQTVFMVDTDTVYAAGSAIYKSINGGGYFLPQPSTNDGLEFNGIAFSSSTTGYAVGDFGLIRRTVNGGDPSPLHDASIGEIEPFPSNPCPDLFPVRVRVKNVGFLNLTQTTIHWEVDGVQQPDFLWTGNLAAGQSSDFLTIGSYNFPLGTSMVKVWTSDPNGGPDDFPGNDMLSAPYAVKRLLGTYTIGGANPDFPTLAAAIDAIKYPGICGPVVFNIRNGTYVGENVIPELQTATPENNVTFQSESGDNTSVILTSFWPNTTLILNGAKHLTFKNITIKSDGTTFNRAVELKNGASDIRFLGNILEGKPTAFTTSDYTVVYSLTQPACTNINFSGNEIRYGSYGIHMEGSSSSKGSGNVFENNVFTDQSKYGLYCVFQAAPRVSGNRVSSNSTTGNLSGIALKTCVDTFQVLKNRIDLKAGIGLSFEYCNILESGEGWIANNFIQMGPGGLGYGLKVEQSHYLQIYYNSVEVRQGGSAVYFYLTDTASYTHINIQNNLFANTGSGSIYNITNVNPNTPTTYYGKIFDEIDHNAYYTAGPVFSKLLYGGDDDVTSLDEWKIALNKDLTSFLADPQFLPGNELYITPQTSNYLLNGAAVPVAAVMEDIDGELRDPSSPDIGADEFVQPALDAGVIGMLNAEVYCPGSNPINATIKNYGALPLQNCTIHWAVNGLEQTAYAWNGNLASGEESSPIHIGDYDFYAGNPFNINVWTEAPNGMTDQVASNDPFAAMVSGGGLSGTYTIGGTNPDYPTFNAAQQALVSNGVCGPVVFKVRPGTYNEQVSFPQISGASAIRTITFESENGDSTSVLLTYSANISKNYTFQLDGADYFTFRKMSFTGTNSTDYNTILFLKNSANHNQFLHNRFEGLSSTLNYNWYTLVDSDGSLDEFNLFEGNVFENSAYPIRFVGKLNSIGDVITYERGNRVIGNTITGARYMGIRMYYQQDPVLEGNTIDMAVPGGAGTGNAGIYLAFSIGKIRIQKNKVRGIVQDGIQVYHCRSGNFDKGLVANNFVSITGGVSTALTMGECVALDVLYNSLMISGPASVYNTAFSITYTPVVNMTIRNNNFVNLSGGRGVYALSGDYIGSDYNNYFTSSGLLAVIGGWEYYDIPSLQNGAGHDQHSLSVDPGFVSVSDLHIISSDVADAGIPIAAIIDDIDGDPRDPSQPDIGADEFIPLEFNAGIVQFNSPVPGTAYCGATPDIVVTLKNFGSALLESADIVLMVNGLPYDTFSWTGALPYMGKEEVYLGSYPFGEATAYELLCFATSPNGQADQYVKNDTAHYHDFFMPLSGDYLVGPGGNFASIAEMNANLLKGGVCGPVTIQVADGIYEENMSFSNFPGSSAENPLTITSASADSSKVVITGDPLSAAQELVLLDGVSYVTLSHLTFDGNGSGVHDLVHIRNGHDLAITNSAFTGYHCNCSQGSQIAINALEVDSNLTIRQNTIQGTFLGMNISGDPLNGKVSSANFRIENNEIFSTFQLEQAARPVIRDNLIDGPLNYLRNCGGFEITHNRFFGGLRIQYSTGDTTSVFQNNALYTYQPSAGYPVSWYAALVVDGTGQIDIIHNTLKGNSAAGALHLQDYSNARAFNNIFYQDDYNGGYILFQQTSNDVLVSDHNLFFRSDSAVSVLTDRQDLYGQDLHSWFIDPQFSANPDSSLYPTNGAINDLGTSMGISDDLFHYPRHPLFPEVGALEFALPPLVDLGPDRVWCEEVLLDANNAGASYLWSDGSTGQTLLVTESGQYWVQVTTPLGTVSDTINIALFDPPILQLEDTIFCLGADAVLSAGVDNVEYLWSTGETTPWIFANWEGEYALTITNSIGCTAVDTVQVSFYPYLWIESQVTIETCFGDSTGMIELVVSGGQGNYSFAWENSPVTGPVLSNLTAGSYMYWVTDGACTYNGSIELWPGIEVQAMILNTDSACVNQVYYFENGSYGADQFSWFIDDTSVSNEVNFQFVFENSGIYSVSLVASYGACMDTAFYSLVVLSESECNPSAAEEPRQATRIFPNPVKDWLYIEGLQAGTRVEIFDVTGVKWIAVDMSNMVAIDVSKLPEGGYLLVLDNSEREFFVKMD